MFPDMRREFDSRINRDDYNRLSVTGSPFRRLKERLILARFAIESPHYSDIDRNQQEELMHYIITEGGIRSGLYSDASKSASKPGFFSKMKELVTGKEITIEEDLRRRASRAVHNISDKEFLDSLNDLLGREPSLEQPVTETLDAAHDYLDILLQKSLRYLAEKLSSVQEQFLNNQIAREAGIIKENKLKECRRALVREVNSTARPETT